MSELELKDCKFESLVQEFNVRFLGEWFVQSGMSYFWFENPLESPDVELVDRIPKGKEHYNYYSYTDYIFKYKGSYFKIEKCDDSYGNSGWSEDGVVEVFPKEVTKVIYE